MKDLTHYFSDPGKITQETAELKEVTNEPSVLARTENSQGNIGKRKRSRVKIKISQSNTRGRVCDIVDSQNDLIDKTPSPFNGSIDKAKYSSPPDVTPKRLKIVSSGKQAKEIHQNIKLDLDSSCESIFSPKRPKKADCAKNSPSEREKSNAFDVLMTRSKPIKYVSPPESTPSKETQESTVTRRQNKEKIISLADKKGYSKRKMLEKEEEEKIEKQIEERVQMFKRNTTNENLEISPPIINQRTPARGLHNYFHKLTAEEREQAKLLEVSTVVVQAEIHGAKIMTSIKSLRSKTNSKVAKSRSRKVLAASDDIQVLRTGTPSPTPPQLLEEEPKEKCNPGRIKPKWTLRINVPSSEYENAESDPEMENDDTELTKSKKCTKTRIITRSKIKKQPLVAILKSPNKCDSEISDENTKKITSGNLPELTCNDKESSPDEDIIDKKFPKRPSNEKLAPLFIKRPKPDPEVVAARRLFLQSRSPDIEKRKLAQKSSNTGTSILPFPLISHVTQLEDGSESHGLDLGIKYRTLTPSVPRPPLNVGNLKCVTTLNNHTPKPLDFEEHTAKPNPEEVLREIEDRCSDAREIWRTITGIGKKKNHRTSPRKVGRKRKSLEKTSVLENDENSTWTQKYRPMNAKEVIGNEVAALKLQDWLKNWRASTKKDDDSSGDDFYSSDTNFSETNNAAVLLGPHGSGKTASVYAIAEELGYSVLELNASSKRPGKKILKDFDEATKSHRVKKSNMQMCSSDKNCKNVPRNSLILIEDVDLIFDEDEGFTSAIYQLASNTKRPIVMTCRDSCPHLNRIAPQQQRIHFQTTFGSRASTLLELITLAETGIRLSRSCVDQLLMQGDLRKALLQLQYLLVSGSSRSLELHLNFRDTLWQDVKSFIYKPAVKMQTKKGKKNIRQKQINIIENLAEDLDTIAFVSSLVDVRDETLNMCRVKFEPSLSLVENENLYSSNDMAIMDISIWLRNQVMDKRGSVNHESSDIKHNRKLSLRKELNIGLNVALSQISPNTLDKKVMSIDYLPSVRSICRAEDIKAAISAKRSNRYFHYLQNLRMPSDSLKPNVLSAACKIMHENPEKENTVQL